MSKDRAGGSRVFNFIKAHKKKYLVGLFFLLVINILQILVPKITGDVVDRLQEQSIESRNMWIYPAMIMAVSLASFISHYLSRLQINGAGNLFDYETRNAMFKHLLDLSMSFFQKKATGDIMALTTNDLGALRMTLSRGIMLLADTIILSISSIIIMIGTVNLKLTLLVSIPFPFMIWVMVRFGTIINRRFRRVQDSFADITRKAQENIAGIRVIKAFVQEDNEKVNFDRLNQENFQKNMKLAKAQGLFFPLISFLSSISYLIALVYGGNLILNGQITLGDFVAFNGYIGVIVRPIHFIGRIINMIQRGKASMDRIEELFNEKPEVKDEVQDEVQLDESSEKELLRGKIEFKNLTFSYEPDQPPVLKNIKLSIEPGKTLGIIGKVGSGKSTIANLLLRLYNPNSRGQLFIDGKDIMDIPLKKLRDSIGYVPQDNFLFSSSIYDNIAFNPYNTKMEDVRKAAQISQIDETIMEMEKKYNTMLGERGVNLSGGQKQRVSIARALVKNPSILILDDCLSAVDTNTERKILEKLRPFMARRTCIIIAHRISTIQHADEIIVLDEGRIIERGTHQELLELKGYHYELYNRQLLEEAIESA